MKTVGLIILLVLVLALIYCFYQEERNRKVSKIRKNWIMTNNPKIHKYTYDYMFDPSFKNWLGLKFPTESDF